MISFPQVHEKYAENDQGKWDQIIDSENVFPQNKSRNHYSKHRDEKI